MQRLFRPLTLAITVALTTTATYAAAPGSRIDPASLDANVAPCTDFYNYVNGKWVAANPIPADRTRWGTFDELREASLQSQRALIESSALAKVAAGSIEQKLGDFYASGMDEAAVEKVGVAPLQPELAKIAAITTSADLSAYLIDAHARGLGQVFGFGAYPDFKNSQMVIGYAGEDGLGLPERAYYLEDKSDYVRIRGEYVAHIEKTLALAGVKADEAKQDAQAILALETQDAKASLSPTESRDPKNQYHYMSLADADKATPHFSWTRFFAAQGLKDSSGFSLSHPEWFTAFDRMLSDVPVAQWKAYLRYHAIDDASPFLGQGVRRRELRLPSAQVARQKEMEPRWKRTLNAVNANMGMAMGQLYVAKNFPPESKQRAQDLVDNLRVALRARIEKLDWMSDATKKKAIEKWETFRPKIGYPDKWRDWTGLSITRASYIDNVLAAKQVQSRLARRPYRQTGRQDRVGHDAADRQRLVQSAQERDHVPCGDPAATLLRRPRRRRAQLRWHRRGDRSRDDARLRRRGQPVRRARNNSNWWTDEDKKQFEGRTAKLVKQFDDYVALEDLHVKGKLTLGENIADLGGLNVAYDALQVALKKNPAEAKGKIDGFTQDQRFFLGFARVWRTNTLPSEAKVRLNTDPHAPGQFRAIAAPSNMPAFAQAFSCKGGSTMVRATARR